MGQIHWRDGPGGCVVRLFVDPARRRRGVGRALFSTLVDVARVEGRAGVTVEVAPGSPAEAACRADGFQPDMPVELNGTRTDAVDLDLLRRWQRAGEAASGYSLVAYDAPCPDAALAEGFVHARHAMNDAPRWEGEPEHTYTVTELGAVEEACANAHVDWWSVGVRHDATGEIVGLSEIYLPHARPWVGLQGDTGVAPAHRGHGLGAWMKAINHQRLLGERPAVQQVRTWNASSNEPMLRINRALGFQPIARFQGWWLPLA